MTRVFEIIVCWRRPRYHCRYALRSGSIMLNRSNTRHSPHLVAAFVIGAVVIVLVAWQAKSSVKSTKPLSPVELEIVGTWEYPADQFGEDITITFSKDRTYTHSKSRSDSSVHPAHWRIDGANLIIEQTGETIVGGPPSLPIPNAVRGLHLPEAMWHSEMITQAVSFSDSGDLQLNGVWPACTLARCETTESNLSGEKGISKP